MDQEMMSLLNGLAGLGFDELVHFSLSRVAPNPDDRQSEAKLALAGFHGNSAEPPEAAALRRLKSTLDSSPASQAIVDEAYKRFVAVGGPEQSDLTAFLIAAADKRSLSPMIISLLVSKARESLSGRNYEFMDAEYARILAHAASQLPEASRPIVYQLIDKAAAAVTPIASGTAEIYTALARQGLGTPAMFSQILANAGAAPPYQPQNPNFVSEPQPGLSIVVGYGPWLTALAIVGAGRPLTQKAITILEEHADDPSLHELIIRALARQPTEPGQQCWKSGCARVLKSFPEDAARRRLISDLLAERLAAVPRGEFLAALERLRKERMSEIEPEIRIALGLTAINAQLARVRTIPIGDQLFDDDTRQ
jgi:hypothetical protein